MEEKIWNYTQVFSQIQRDRFVFPYNYFKELFSDYLCRAIREDGWEPIKLSLRLEDEEMLVPGDIPDTFVWVELDKNDTDFSMSQATQFKETWSMVGVKSAEMVDRGNSLAYYTWCAQNGYVGSRVDRREYEGRWDNG